MVSVTLDDVSVTEVIDPWVKLGTTGTALAAPDPVNSSNIVIRVFITSYLIVISLTNWPVAFVPAPPAVRVVTPAEVIVPANVPATPPEFVWT